jgi:hypothetical protein
LLGFRKLCPPHHLEEEILADIIWEENCEQGNGKRGKFLGKRKKQGRFKGKIEVERVK